MRDHDGRGGDQGSGVHSGSKMSQASTEHIVIDDNGVARIARSRIKVIHLVIDKRAFGWCPEEIQAQYPHLSLADVHAAFAYYYDHKADLDAAVDESSRFVDEMRAKADQTWIVDKLRAMGKLP
jgi:uncharacterized protein (DUF433 family)